MFGTVFVCFQSSMKKRLGEAGWKALLEECDLPADKIYRTARFYPNQEFETLFDKAVLKTGMMREDLYRELGKDFGRHLITTYSRMFFPSWGTMEVIEKAAPIVFKTIQLVDPTSPKSTVACTRVSSEEVVIQYISPRKMCMYILGIVDAMGEHFGEAIDVTQPICMHRGMSKCEIHVRLVRARASVR